MLSNPCYTPDLMNGAKDKDHTSLPPVCTEFFPFSYFKYLSFNTDPSSLCTDVEMTSGLLLTALKPTYQKDH